MRIDWREVAWAVLGWAVVIAILVYNLWGARGK
jgi:hypothetical protein